MPGSVTPAGGEPAQTLCWPRDREEQVRTKIVTWGTLETFSRKLCVMGFSNRFVVRFGAVLLVL